MPLIAIDGPSGSGKSTVARAVASRLGLAYLDTGAMYRSVALAALRRGIDPGDTEAVAALAGDVDIVVEGQVLVDGVVSTAAIRAPDVTVAVTAVAANPGVRRQMVKRQQAWAERHGGGVVEGRDIGTIVFPDADVKVFLTADPGERARRRSAEVAELGLEEVAADMARRDHVDSTRAASPLTRAGDAVAIDTTGRQVDDVVDQVLALVKKP